jgi:hypothetical protein
LYGRHEIAIVTTQKYEAKGKSNRRKSQSVYVHEHRDVNSTQKIIIHRRAKSKAQGID